MLCEKAQTQRPTYRKALSKSDKFFRFLSAKYLDAVLVVRFDYQTDDIHQFLVVTGLKFASTQGMREKTQISFSAMVTMLFAIATIVHSCSLLAQFYDLAGSAIHGGIFLISSVHSFQSL